MPKKVPMDFTLINLFLPIAIDLYKKLWRDANPNQPELTDEQALDGLLSRSAGMIDKYTAWLAAHPKTP